MAWHEKKGVRYGGVGVGGLVLVGAAILGAQWHNDSIEAIQKESEILRSEVAPLVGNATTSNFIVHDKLFTLDRGTNRTFEFDDANGPNGRTEHCEGTFDGATKITSLHCTFDRLVPAKAQ